MAWADRQWVGDDQRWSVRCRHCGHDWEPFPIYVRSELEVLVLEPAEVMTACPNCRQGVTYRIPLTRVEE